MQDSDIQKQWREYYPKVYGYFFRRLNSREDVEDLTSVCLSTFFTKLLDSPSQVQNPPAYLWKIVYNQLNLFLRNKIKTTIPIGIDDDFEAPKTEDPFSQSFLDKAKEVWEIAQIHCSQNELLILQAIFLDNKKSSQVAVEMNLKADTVRQRLKRTLDKLRKHLKPI